MERKKIINSVLFFIIGVGLFMYVYRDINLSELSEQLKHLNFFWIALSVSLSLVSQIFRAWRWKMLFTPMEYRPKTYNLFLAILVLSFTNLIIPRGGEIARSGVVTRYDKVPFVKVMGTVIVERIIDLMVLLLIFIIILLWQFNNLKALLQNPDLQFDFSGFTSKVIWVVVIAIAVSALLYILNRLGIFKNIKNKFRKVKVDFADSIRSVRKMKNTGSFILLTLLIYFFWLMMLYVIIFSYEPVSHITFGQAAFTFGMATFSFILPIQAGTGAWHFVVIQCLLLFGVDVEAGKVFALIAHSFTHLIYLIFGTIGFMLLPLVNGGKNPTP